MCQNGKALFKQEIRTGLLCVNIVSNQSQAKQHSHGKAKSKLAWSKSSSKDSKTHSPIDCKISELRRIKLLLKHQNELYQIPFQECKCSIEEMVQAVCLSKLTTTTFMWWSPTIRFKTSNHCPTLQATAIPTFSRYIEMFELKMTNSLFTRFDRAIERHVRTMEYLIYWKWICTFFLFEIYQMMRPIFLWASSVA